MEGFYQEKSPPFDFEQIKLNKLFDDFNLFVWPKFDPEHDIIDIKRDKIILLITQIYDS